MKTERIAIKNRHELKLVIQVDTPDNPNNLVFIEPGQGGFIEQEHIEAFAQAFLENSFRAVRFDPSHSVGESEGAIQDVAYTGYIEDLEDVINWARNQPWFQQPYALCGHSMGGVSTTWYAEKHPDEILCLAPISTAVNYELYLPTMDDDFFRKWREKGYYETTSNSKPGVIKRIGIQILEDMKKYDLLISADKLTMPVLLMAGENDRPTPYLHQKILFDALPGKNKELIKIENADHNFRGPNNYGKTLREVKQAISDWIKSQNT